MCMVVLELCSGMRAMCLLVARWEGITESRTLGTENRKTRQRLKPSEASVPGPVPTWKGWKAELLSSFPFSLTHQTPFSNTLHGA